MFTKFKMHWIETVKATLLIWRLPKHLIRKKQTWIMRDEEYIYGQTGVFELDTLESKIKDINGIRIKQSFIGRIFNYGDITITTPSTSHHFKSMANPKEIKETMLKVE